MKKVVKKEKCSGCSHGKMIYTEFSGKDTPNKDGSPAIIGTCDYCGKSE